MTQQGDRAHVVGGGPVGKLDARRLISKIFPLDEAVTAIDSLRRAEGMKVLIMPGETRRILQP